MPDVEGMRIAFLVFPGYFIAPPLRVLSKPVVQVEPLVQTVFSGHRRWWRKLPRRPSVGALLILVLVFVLGGVLGWSGWVAHLAYVQRDAVAAIRSGGGQVQYDWQLKSLPDGNAQFDPTGRPEAPNWLLDCLGHDFFGNVEHVELGPRNTDAVIKQVGRLEKLRRLNFFTGIDLTPLASAGINSLPNAGPSRIQVLLRLFTADLSPPRFNGANFKYLENLTRLESLNLPDNISVTDADLTHLSRLTALSSLELHDPRITDAGLVSLKDMARLKKLSLSGTQVSGAELSTLRAMTELKHLDLSRTQVGDEGASALSDLTALKSLNLNHTPITDVTLNRLAGMSELQDLSCGWTDITDRGLAKLTECRALKKLNVRGTRIGPDGLGAFHHARPDVNVAH
jgi:hypothetical protein